MAMRRLSTFRPCVAVLIFILFGVPLSIQSWGIRAVIALSRRTWAYLPDRCFRLVFGVRRAGALFGFPSANGSTGT